MLFGSHVRLKRTRFPKLYINNVLIDFVHQYKYLGVILVRQYLTEFASITIYKTMILPYFDYGDILFMNSQQKLLKKIRPSTKKGYKNLLVIRSGYSRGYATN